MRKMVAGAELASSATSKSCRRLAFVVRCRRRHLAITANRYSAASRSPVVVYIIDGQQVLVGGPLCCPKQTGPWESPRADTIELSWRVFPLRIAEIEPAVR